jgi:UDP-N-acetylmuramoyl-tripeptide--D-alanyl-D-alanine ligase
MSESTLLAIFSESKGVSIDTRDDLKDKIFFALRGENFNGNKFAIQAISQGAICAVVDDEKVFEMAASSHVGKLYFVDNALAALQNLAKEYRDQIKIPVIGITGTNGKTTTKELLTCSLSKKFNVVSTSGNFNNHIGLPLTILKIKSDTDIAVVEMGASKKGDIAELCQIAKPTHGLITNIGTAHLEGFLTKAAIAKTKGELYQYLNDHQGTIFVNKKDETLIKLVIKLVTFKKTKVIKYGDEKIIDKNKNKHLIGDYNLFNMRAAKAVSLHFSVAEKKVDEALREYQPENMRSQLIGSDKSKRQNEILMDAYNANPSSMKVSIESFWAEQTVLPKWIILGDMKELGKRSVQEHLKIVRLLKSLKVRDVVFIGKEFYKSTQFARYVPPEYNFFKTKEEFRKSKAAKRIEDSYVLIKGSRGMKLEEILPYL